MKVIAEHRHKNVICQVLARKESEVYIKSDGSYFLGDAMEFARKNAFDFWGSPKNNKRSRKTTTIKEILTPSDKESLKRFRECENAWVNKELKRIGHAKTGGVFTMLKNKGY